MKMFETHYGNSNETPEDFGFKATNHVFKSRDGMKLKGWFIENEEAKGIIILVHGFTTPNGGKNSLLKRAKFFYDYGLSVFLFDLRSFGESEGNLVSLGINEWMDVEAAYDYVQLNLNKKDLNLGIYGNSMGAASVVMMTGKTQKGDFLITTVPFTTIDNLIVPFLIRGKKPLWIRYFVKLALKLKFGNIYQTEVPISYAQNINVPILVIGANNDKTVNPRDAYELYEKITGPKEYHEFASGHGIYEKNEKEVYAIFHGFLDEIFNKELSQLET